MRTFTKLIGASCKYGQRKDGVQSGATNIFKHMGVHKDVNYVSNFEGGGYQELFKVHNHYLTNGWKPLTVGGDHSISLATVASSVEKYKDDLTVVWVDAHADIHTRESSQSQNLHGMPLGSLLGHDALFNFPQIKPDQLVYIGLRDVDQYEKKVIQDLGIRHYTVADIDRYSLKSILSKLYRESTAIHLSFDIDALDPKYISCTGTPVANGLSYQDAVEIITTLRPKIISSDIVEFNPLIGDKKQTVKEAFRIINLIKLLD
tara:strand:+ start:361 stop:1143 length:783 start_codon:yes stop_codon:yes gene_type:complete